MRVWPVLLLVCAVGCKTTRPLTTSETRAELPTGRFITLPKLARDLALAYRGEGQFYIELSSPTDNVMLVRDSRQAIVSGRELEMTYPCMQRGREFVLARADAVTVTRTLNEIRATRVRRAPVVVRTPDPDPGSTGLPAAWRPRAPERDWHWIVIHHAATPRGSAAVIHRMHRQKGWDGLGYHFVIGNGTLTGDGEVEVGYRWTRQIHGAHARARPGDDNRWNLHGIGICMVGDYQTQTPSDAQMDALVRLVRSLMAEYGIGAREVVPHRHVSKTLCPGSRFPWGELSARIR